MKKSFILLVGLVGSCLSGCNDHIADPVPEHVATAWSAGGMNKDMGIAIGVDKRNDIYVTGSFKNTADFGDMSLTRPVDQHYENAFIAKYSPEGKIKWVQEPTSSRAIRILDMKVDGDGNSYVTGVMNSDATFGNKTITGNGVFVAKYNSDGVVQWVQKPEGDTGSQGFGIDVDANGNVYIIGFFNGEINFGGTILKTNATTFYDDAFLVKLNSAGEFQWAQKFGDKSGGDQGFGVTVDGKGNIYATGAFSNTVTFGRFTLTSSQGSDVFISKLNSSGTVEWVQKAGGGGFDVGREIVVDGNSNVYVVYIDQNESKGFTLKLDSSGAFQWELPIAGGVAAGEEGSIYLSSPLTKVTSTGHIEWQKPGEGGSSLSLTRQGTIYVTGSFYNSITRAGTTLTSKGDTDIYVARYLKE